MVMTTRREMTIPTAIMHNQRRMSVLEVASFAEEGSSVEVEDPYRLCLGTPKKT
jgi:hypothetical protein